MQRLILNIIGATLSIFLSVKFLSGVSLQIIPQKSIFLGVALTEQWQIFLLVGTVMGLISFFIKPILKAITVPLKILTLGLFSLILNMVLVWFVDIIFPELQILGLAYLFYTTLIAWVTNTILIGVNKR
jgi:putative membrane protein